jgi:hypothetical protein
MILIGITNGCARNQVTSKRVCDEYAVPASNTIYLYVSNEYSPPEKVAELLRNKTTYALLRVADEVKVINSIDEAKKDGFSLEIDIVNIQQSTFARRIDIRYSLIDNETNTDIIQIKDAVRSRTGYNGAAEDLSIRTARQVARVLNCFNIRRKENAS